MLFEFILSIWLSFARVGVDRKPRNCAATHTFSSEKFQMKQKWKTNEASEPAEVWINHFDYE